MSTRNYSNVARPLQITGAMTAAQTTVPLSNVAATGWPAFPFAAALERGTSQEELVLVIGSTADLDGKLISWTVNRAYGDTTAKAHPSGAKIEHVTNAVDFRQFASGTNEITDNISASRLPRSYPEGFSRMYVVDTGGWPGQWGNVDTIRRGVDVTQRYMAVVDGQFWWRHAYSTADVWQPWQRVADGREAGYLRYLGV